MKVKLYLLVIAGCFSTLALSKDINNNPKKAIQGGSSVMVGTMKYSYGHGEITTNEGLVERKRSHKRRKAVRKPRRGRGQ